MHTYIYTYIHTHNTHTYTYIHIYIYTHIHINKIDFPPQDRHIEKESLSEYITKKREMFLVQVYAGYVIIKSLMAMVN